MSFSVGDAPPGNKVVLVGNPGVGKSTIFQYFKTGRFVPTSQLNHHDKAEHTKEWMVEGVSRTITLFDTAGVERHTQTMLPTYFRRAKAVILVYSIDNMESFGDISSNWMDNCTNSADEAELVLVGNKVDLDRRRADSDTPTRIPLERALQYALHHDIDKSMVFEISAKTGRGVSEMFDAIAEKIAPASSPPAVSTPTDKPHKPDCSC